jgi:hypothetical protein
MGARYLIFTNDVKRPLHSPLLESSLLRSNHPAPPTVQKVADYSSTPLGVCPEFIEGVIG